MLRLSLPVLFVVLFAFGSVVHGRGTKPAGTCSGESSASYRYRSSQAAHWRAVTLRPQSPTARR